MHYLFVTATNQEIEPLAKALKEIEQMDEKLKRYSWGKLKIDILTTGVGMTSTAYYLGKTLTNRHYNAAFNLGICGSFDRGFSIGDVVEITVDQIAEFGAEDGNNFISVENLGISPTEIVMKNKMQVPLTCLKLLPKTKAITVNKVHGSIQSINKTVSTFSPQVESMEGAAFFLACNDVSIPYAQVRAISNYVEKRNKEAWDIPLAIKRLNLTAIEILNELERL